MSRSRKKPVYGDNYRDTVCYVDDTTNHKWKKSYNRLMRRHNKQRVSEMEKTDIIDLEEDTTVFLDDPEKTNIGNTWNSPSDGWTLFSGNTEKEKRHLAMK